jgi:hypothetical protein
MAAEEGSFKPTCPAQLGKLAERRKSLKHHGLQQPSSGRFQLGLAMTGSSGDED